MRGDKRVAIRFNMVARKASDEATHTDYVEQVKASDNLRWSLGGGMASGDEKPLGKTAAHEMAATGSTLGSPQ